MIRAAVLLAVVVATSAGATTQVHWVMGTFLRVDVDEAVGPDAFAGCFAEARALDRAFSRYDPTSELVRLNAAGGGPASARFRDGLGRAMDLARAGDGTFDVTVGALTALWRAPGRPDAAAVAAARATVGGASIDGAGLALAPGTRLDFDGFAKGMAVDACVASLRAVGVSRALVSFGESSLYGLGAPRGADAWRVGVRGPDPDRVVGALALRDRAAAVSAVFGGAGHRANERAHVIDPRSGRPLVDDVVSVVVAPSAADAEAWAKTALVAGPAGVAAAEAHAGVEAARLGRGRDVALGAAMRAAGRLHLFARSRPLGGEVALR